MQDQEQIAHEGIITNCFGNAALVHLIQAESCHSCHMKEFCGVDDQERSTFIVENNGYHVGDHVHLVISAARGLKATFWAYIFPFLLMLAVILIGTIYNFPESVLGLFALLLLIPYFLGLAKFRHKLKSGFQLKVTRL
ncbi:MAG: positive regulator of sigma E activity [Cyclobacteriaceae bacterium]|jgi:positive regulator of sigma E activity